MLTSMDSHEDLNKQLISAAEAQLLHAAPSLIGDIVCQLEDRLATLLVSGWEQSIRVEAYRGEVVG